MLRFWMVVFGACVVMPVMANDCLQYKLKPRIDINIPDWVKEVVQPRKPMDLWHGNVVATFVPLYLLSRGYWCKVLHPPFLLLLRGSLLSG